MIEITSDNIWKEIDAAESVRDERLRTFQNTVDSYSTPFFKGDHSALDDTGQHYNPENHEYEFVRFMVPQIVYNAPRVRLSSRTYGADQSVRELSYGINQWVQDTDYGDFLIGPAHDCLFAWAATLTTYEDHPYIEGGKTCVKTRLSPRHYFRDPGALTAAEARYHGHSYIVDRQDLIDRAESEGKEAGWIIENVESTVENAGVDEYRKAHPARATIPDRKEVVVYEVWMRDYEDKDHPGGASGHHGTILTLGVSGGDADGNGREARFLRDPIPYYGPASGPYNVCEIHDVPDDPYGLSPLVAVQGQTRDLNRHARGSSRAAAAYKRLILCDTTDPDFVDKVQLGEHDLVLPIEKVEKDRVLPVEIGGITQQNLAYLELARDRLDRNSGMTDAQRGLASGGTTATESAIADQNADIGVDFLRKRFHAFVREDLEKVLWYMWRDDDFALILGPDAGPELGIIQLEDLEQAVVTGHVTPEQAIAAAEEGRVMGPGDTLRFNVDANSVAFETLSLEIEPMSMERTTAGMAQQRALQMFQLVSQVGQLVPVMPWVRWEELLDKLGDALNVPDLGDLIDVDLAAQAAGAMASPMPQATGSSPVGSQPAAPQPVTPQPQRQSTGLPGNQTGGALAAGNTIK